MLRGSLGLAAATALGKPYIANAAATTATVWVNQGFVQAEDDAFKQLAADYMKASGNTLDYSIMPFQAQNQKTVSALTSGDVPDLVFMDAPQSIIPQNALDDKLVDVSDIVKPYEAQLSKTARECSTFYNKTAKAHSYYLAPIKQACIPFHIWGSLVEKAGLKLSDAPKTWDAFWDFFKPAQKELRGKGMRKIYALGLQITTVGPNDGNGLFHPLRDRQRRQYGHAGWPAAHRRPEGARGGDQVRRLPDRRLQAGLRTARGVELERCGRQQRLPRKGVRRRLRRHDLD